LPVKTSAIIGKINELEKDEGHLHPLFQFYRELLNIQNKTEQQIKVINPGFTVQAVKAHALKGRALLNYNLLNLDWQILLQTFKEVAALCEDYKELFGSIPPEIYNLGPRRILTKQNVRAWYNNRPLVLPNDSTPDTQRFLNNLFHATIKPFLIRQAAALADLIENDVWKRNHCPICGGSPDFAYLTKDTGLRCLVCSRCDTEWVYQRLQCPFCNNNDQNTLSYLTGEDGRYRLYLCEKCHCYIKAIDLRVTDKEIIYPLERFLTLDIDRQAQEKGYQPCL
jgi:hypothetical protein